MQPMENLAPTEVQSMAVWEFFNGKRMRALFEKDPDYFYNVLGVVSAQGEVP